jgi:predicted protein tyrosine phosphatase
VLDAGIDIRALTDLPLYLAVESEFYDGVTLLLAKGAQLSTDGYAAIIAAIHRELPNILDVMLRHIRGVQLDIPIDRVRFMMEQAVLFSGPKVAGLIIGYMRDTYPTILDQNYMNHLLVMAVRNTYPNINIVQYLLDQGADPAIGLGNVKHAAIIQLLTRKQIKDKLDQQIITPSVNGRCIICLSQFKQMDQALKTGCGHEFHRDCLHRYIDSKDSVYTCPLCRATL